jgi:signal transduction histidine kinase
MVTQNIETLEMLVIVSRLLSSKLDISELLLTIMRLASRVVGAERASLYLLDEKTQQLYFDVALGLPEDVQKIRLNLGEGVAGTCALNGKSIISNNVENDERHSKKIDEQSGFTTRSLLTCPMIIKGKVIGVVQAINKIDGDFTESDKNNFEAFASQAAIAIENSRLFNGVKEEKKKLEIVFKKIKEGAILTDSNGDIILLNNSASLYLEYEKYNYKNISEIFKVFNQELNLNEILNTDSNSFRFLLERQEPKKLILEVLLMKVITEGQNKVEPFLWIVSDVTEQKMEERLSRNFLSLISHKFKTPMSVINGYAQILSENKDAPENIKKACISIYNQGQKLSELINTLIDYTTVENMNKADLNRENIQVSKLFGEINSEIANKYENVDIKIVVQEDFEINADISLFKKAIKEIIHNGIKFNKSEKKIIILSSSVNNDKKMISIGDNGNGIPGEEIEKIFNKFYQIEASFTGQVEGWGLGLSMVKKISDLHDFKIVVKSQLQKGSAFTLILN